MAFPAAKDTPDFQAVMAETPDPADQVIEALANVEGDLSLTVMDDGRYSVKAPYSSKIMGGATLSLSAAKAHQLQVLIAQKERERKATKVVTSWTGLPLGDLGTPYANTAKNSSTGFYELARQASMAEQAAAARRREEDRYKEAADNEFTRRVRDLVQRSALVPPVEPVATTPPPVDLPNPNGARRAISRTDSKTGA